MFDADGHIDEDNAAIAVHLHGEYANPRRPKGFAIFPSLDGWSRGVMVNRNDPDRVHRHTDAAIWGGVLDTLGLGGVVLYPTEGLAAGLIQDAGWAVAATRAYNDWLEAEYTRRDARLLGAALLPVQDPPAAVAELRRCRERTGFVAGVLPTVTVFAHTYGDARFWPLFEEAERLGIPLALHGGPAQRLGLEHFEHFAKVHALSHPVAMLKQVTDLVLSGVFDAFPGLRIACLEAGSGWVPYWMDRLDHEASVRRGLPVRRRPSEYFRQNLWVSVDVAERCLPWVIDVMGADRLFFATDYGHETPFPQLAGDLREFLGDARWDDATRRGLLGDNARRFYAIGERVATTSA